MERKVGEVTHFFAGPSAAVLKLSAGLNVGDEIHIVGATTDLNESVTSMQIDHNSVEAAHPGDDVAILVKDRVREGDEVFVVEAGGDETSMKVAPEPVAAPIPVAIPARVSAPAAKAPASKSAAKPKAKPKKAKAKPKAKAKAKPKTKTKAKAKKAKVKAKPKAKAKTKAKAKAKKKKR